MGDSQHERESAEEGNEALIPLVMETEAESIRPVESRPETKYLLSDSANPLSVYLPNDVLSDSEIRSHQDSAFTKESDPVFHERLTTALELYKKQEQLDCIENTKNPTMVIIIHVCCRFCE